MVRIHNFMLYKRQHAVATTEAEKSDYEKCVK